MSDAPFRDNDGPPEPPLDRTISPIAGRLGSPRAGKALVFGGLLAGCAVLALASYGADHRQPPAPPDRPARQVVAFEPTKASVAPTLAAPGAGPGANPGDVPAIAPEGAIPPRPEAPGAPGRDRQIAPLVVYSRDAAVSTSSPGQIMAPADPAPATELDALRRSSRIGRVAAWAVGDRNVLILAGATLPCVLQTAIDTATPGYVTCLIGSDIYSDNGAVVLLDKGARVLGEYRGGLRQGQNRIFVLWTRAVTPRGVAIDLGSPASDALGRAGFGGMVDTHFWDRFGAALLLSVVDDGVEALADGDPRSRTRRLPSDAAGLAVQQGGSIPPSLRKPAGAEVAIQVAQDLDFSDVYALAARP